MVDDLEEIARTYAHLAGVEVEGVLHGRVDDPELPRGAETARMCCGQKHESDGCLTVAVQVVDVIWILVELNLPHTASVKKGYK